MQHERHEEPRDSQNPSAVEEVPNERRVETRPANWDIWHGVLGATALGFAIMSAWLWSEVSEEKSQARSDLSASQQRAQQLVDQERTTGQQNLSQAREQAAQQQASAFATAIQPILTFMGQVPEITDRSIQAATRNLAQQGNYSMVAVTDASGKIIGSSDLTTLGRSYEGQLEEGVSMVEGQNQAVATIGDEGSTLGYVVVRIRD